MRILVTGMTSTAANAGGPRRRKYAVSTNGLVAALHSLGHTVDQRPVRVGEDLSAYDRAVVVLHDCRIWGTLGLRWGAMWAAVKVPTVFAVDDWPVEKILSSFHRFWWDTGQESSSALLALDHKRVVDLVLSDIDAKRVPVMAGLYPWGDARKLCQHRVLRWDPSAWVECHPLELEVPRLRAWVNAHLALDECEDLLSTSTWPKLSFSSKDGTLVPEPELVGRIYRRNWGVVARTYPHSGAGWWRARFQFAAEAGAVLLCSPKECGLRGYGQGTELVESLTDDGLLALATDQKASFWGAAQSKEAAAAAVEKHLEEARTW